MATVTQPAKAAPSAPVLRRDFPVDVRNMSAQSRSFIVRTFIDALVNPTREVAQDAKMQAGEVLTVHIVTKAGKRRVYFNIRDLKNGKRERVG